MMSRRKIKYTIISLLVGIVSFTACTNTTEPLKKLISGKKNIDKNLYEIEVGSFSNLEVRGVANLMIEQGDKPLLRVETDEEGMKELKVTIENGTLVIDSLDWERLSKAPTFQLTFQNLREISLKGSSSLRSMGNPMMFETLTIHSSGTSVVNLPVKAELLEIDLSGSTNVTLSGEAKHQEISMSGSSIYKALDLASEMAKVEIAGSAAAWIDVSHRLDINVNGSGAVYYRGSPEMHQKVHGSGKIQKLDTPNSRRR